MSKNILKEEGRYTAHYYYKGAHHCYKKNFDTKNEAQQFLDELKDKIENEYITVDKK